MDFKKQVKDAVIDIENKFDSEKFKDLEILIAKVKENFDNGTAIEISKYAVELSSYLSYISTLLAFAEKEYYLKWKQIKESDLDMTDGKANKLAQATDEHYRRNLLEYKKESVEELIMSLKKLTDAIRTEYSGIKTANNVR